MNQRFDRQTTFLILLVSIAGLVLALAVAFTVRAQTPSQTPAPSTVLVTLPAGLLTFQTCTLAAGDANGDGVVNSSDVFYLINALYSGGPQPHAATCAAWTQAGIDLELGPFVVVNGVARGTNGGAVPLQIRRSGLNPVPIPLAPSQPPPTPKPTASAPLRPAAVVTASNHR